MARLRVFILVSCIGGSPYPIHPQKPLSSQWHCIGNLARAVSTAARFNDALTDECTQPKAACITYTVDPFRESVARMARTPPWKRVVP